MTWQDPGGDASGGGRREADPAAMTPVDPATGPTSPPVPPGPPATPPSWSPAPVLGSALPGDPRFPPDPGYGMSNSSGLRFADVLPRFIAWLIDVLLLSLVGISVSWALSGAILGSVDWPSVIRGFGTGLATGLDGDTLQRFVLVSLAATVIGTVVDFVYFVFLWSSGGRATIGMRILRLQVGNAADGRTLTLGQASRRWLAMGSWIDVLSSVPVVGALAALGQLAWYIVLIITTSSHPSRQGLHDRFAETAVVQIGPAGNAVVAGCLVIAAIVGLFIVISLVAVLFLGSQVSTFLSGVGGST